MGAAELYDADGEQQEAGEGEGTGESLSVAPDVVEVRRNGALAAAVGAVAAAVAIAYLARAAQSGAVLDWVLAAVLGLVSVGWLRAFVDARTPLLVADAQGVRIRLGHTWSTAPAAACSATDASWWWRTTRSWSSTSSTPAGAGRPASPSGCTAVRSRSRSASPPACWGPGTT